MTIVGGGEGADLGVAPLRLPLATPPRAVRIVGGLSGSQNRGFLFLPPPHVSPSAVP